MYFSLLSGIRHKITMMTLEDFLKTVKRNTFENKKNPINETSSNIFLFTFWGQAQQSNDDAERLS